MKFIFAFLLSMTLCQFSDARIRNRKVKEAPKSCKIMEEDSFLSRKDKIVLGTLRHSVLIENDENEKSITLVKDKGEKICQWNMDQWSTIQADNKLPDLKLFKFYIDEYKNVIYPYVQKPDKSYFVMSVPIQTCDLSQHITKLKLELPKCELPGKARKKFRKRSIASLSAKK